MEKLSPTQDLCCENDSHDDDDDDNILSDDHVMLPLNHEDALKCLSQLIKYSSAH
jgi:hypothetical protein